MNGEFLEFMLFLFQFVQASVESHPVINFSGKFTTVANSEGRGTAQSEPIHYPDHDQFGYFLIRIGLDWAATPNFIKLSMFLVQLVSPNLIRSD